MKDLYQILGIDYTTNLDDIKKVFRTLALKLHPDKNNGDKIFDEKFREIREAYEILIDPIKKRSYDSKFKSSFTPKSFKQNPGKYRKPKPTTTSKRYSDDELKEFERRILIKMEAAKKELAYLQKLINSSINPELEDILLRQNKYFENLKEALTRIENKTYGICEITGELIEKERLFSMPHTTLSSKGKNKLFKFKQ